jgi:hypothetical protein
MCFVDSIAIAARAVSGRTVGAGLRLALGAVLVLADRTFTFLYFLSMGEKLGCFGLLLSVAL